MSSRGAPLSERERTRLFTQIFDEWKVISENVDEPETFLRHYLVATGDRKITKKKVVSEVETRISNEDKSRNSQKAEDFWIDMRESSELYSRIISPRDTSERSYHLSILNGLLKSYRIFMLGVYKSSFNDVQIDEIVRLLYVLCFKYVMAGENAQRLEDYFQELCVSIREDASAQEIMDNLATKINGIALDVTRVLSDEADSGFIGKAVLHGVNRKVAHGAIQIPLDRNIHLEHIAPNTSTDDWIRVVLGLGENEPIENDRLRQEYDSLKSEIGNLTLLDEKLNLEAQQSQFGIKTDIYHRSTIMITRDLENRDHWTKSEIQNRTEWIAEMFDMIWAVSPQLQHVRDYSIWVNR
jgi:hypothetical protein